MTARERRTWLISVAGSGVLLAALLYLAGGAALSATVQRVPWPWLLGGVLLLQVEGLCTALRVRLLAAPSSSVFDALVVTAWWVLGLAVLPARLGEVSGLHMLISRLGASPGTALHSLFVQRLFDGVLLLLFGAVAIACQGDMAGRDSLLALLLVTAAATALLLMRLGWCFALVAQLARRYRRQRLMAAVLRAALSGRRAARVISSGRQFAALTAISLLKWLANLAALALIIVALVPLLPWVATGIAVLFNLAAIVPLQTVGGIGIGEVSFTAAAGWYGIDVAMAASAALVLRAVVITAPVLFWFLVMVLELIVKVFPARPRTAA